MAGLALGLEEKIHSLESGATLKVAPWCLGLARAMVDDVAGDKIILVEAVEAPEPDTTSRADHAPPASRPPATPANRPAAASSRPPSSAGSGANPLHRLADLFDGLFARYQTKIGELPPNGVIQVPNDLMALLAKNAAQVVGRPDVSIVIRGT